MASSGSALPPLALVTGADPLATIEGRFDNSGFQFARHFTTVRTDPWGLEGLASAFEGRGHRAIAALRGQGKPILTPGERAMIGVMHLYEGEFEQADQAFAELENVASRVQVELGIDLRVLRGLAALRRGEVENCVDCCNEATCIFPLSDAARHAFPSGSEAAMEHFLAYLDENGGDLGVRWLLNVAAMTLGRYPDGVSEPYRLEFPEETPARPVARFENVSAAAGLNALGPMMAGGSVFDDFDGDHLPDIFLSTYDYQRGAALLLNNGDGTFRDVSSAAGLDLQIAALNCVQADYDNDGRLDVLLLRGGWESPQRLSLLRNRGDGTFEDATILAGLSDPIATQVGAWADYDLDGDLDLFVPSETGEAIARLYRNNGDGTFTDVAEAAGVRNELAGKGASWGDYDDDGDPDLYVSNVNGPNRLYRNNGDGTFTDVAGALKLTRPRTSFACWFFDHDDDGRLDLFVTAYEATLGDVIHGLIGDPVPGEPPALYRNLGPEGFRDVTTEVGLDRVLLPMGCNFGDINGDNAPEIYLGTGRPQYSYLMPNVMLLNEGGTRFVDVTAATGTGHLQKGHGVSFADYDLDGRLDLLLKSGGATPGDRAHSVLFRNPGTADEGADGHWITIKLVGTTSNRSAIGARLALEVDDGQSGTRTLHRHISSGSSFGGNGLAQTIGLGPAKSVATLTIRWPGSPEPQVLRDIPADGVVVITQGSDEVQRVAPGRQDPESPAI